MQMERSPALVNIDGMAAVVAVPKGGTMVILLGGETLFVAEAWDVVIQRMTELMQSMAMMEAGEQPAGEPDGKSDGASGGGENLSPDRQPAGPV